MLDPRAALPPGLAHQDARSAADRFLTLELIDTGRRDPLRLPRPLPAATDVTYRGGVTYRGRPTRIWRFRLGPQIPHSSHHLVGVQAKRQTYYSVYPAILTITDDEDTHLAGWIAGDWRAYSQRERILDVYRRRLSEKPRDARRHYELALIGVTLSTAFVTRSTVDVIHYPGALNEFVPVVHMALERAPGRAQYLALAAFLHERLTEFEQAARLYGAAAAADRTSEIYACLYADSLVFAGDAPGAARAAKEARRRLRIQRCRPEFGLSRRSLLDTFRQGLAEEAWAVRKTVEGLKDVNVDDRARAERHRRAIRIDAKKVPPAFRDLIPLAKQWGVGDDPARGYLTDQASARDKTILRKALPLRRRGEIQAWLDALGPRGITGQEAGAFMYLLEAAEEMGV